MVLYLRVSVEAENNSEQKLIWVRLDPSLLSTEGVPTGDEMGIPLAGMNYKGFVKCKVDITKAIKLTYGRKGWQLGKVKKVRIRGNGKIHSITFT